MPWYDDDYSDRYAVSVDNSAAASTVDVEIAVPSEHPLWDIIQSDGDDIRPTAADGVTLLSYDWSGFNYANRTGTIRIDGLSVQATAGVYLVWLYVGNSSATDGSSAVTITSAVSGYLEMASPQGTPYLARVTRPSPGSTNPQLRFQKQSAEEVHLWYDVTDILERSFAEYEGSDFWEEPYGAQFEIQTGGSAQASMIEQASQRFVEYLDPTQGGRRRYVVVLVKAGSNGTDYTTILDLLTMVPDESQYLRHQPRAFLSVVDTDET